MASKKTFLTCNTWFHIATLLALILLTSSFALGQTETLLYDFQGSTNGYLPSNQMIADKAGNLYGTTNGNLSFPGNVFQLTPPASAGGSWTFTVLYSFTGGSDGNMPVGRLAMDAAGNLYGTTVFGGSSQCIDVNCGTVFRLSPPTSKGGAWTETVLHAFTAGSDGWQPFGGLILDPAGNLYGTTSEGGLTSGCSGAGCGTAFRLSPPTTAGGAWNKATLYVFQGGSDASLPVTELVMDGQHNLYGRSAEGGTGGAGAIFELSPPKTHGPWTEKIIYSVVTPTTPKFISSYNGLVRDRAGALYSTLYGGTSGFGEVFQLVPPSSAGGSWTFNTVYNFQGGSDGVTPVGTLILSPSGKLFGSTLYGGTDGMGTAYQLAPPAQTGGSWTETILYSFTGGSNDGANPDAGLTFGSGGLLYGTTSDGGTDNSRACPSFAPGPGCGTIFSVQP